MTTITVFGGTGFLDRRLVLRLVAEGASVRVAVRYPDPARRSAEREQRTRELVAKGETVEDLLNAFGRTLADLQISSAEQFEQDLRR